MAWKLRKAKVYATDDELQADLDKMPPLDFSPVGEPEYLADVQAAVDDALAELGDEVGDTLAVLDDASPAIRLQRRLIDECSDPDVTFQVAELPIDLRGLRRVETEDGIGIWVRDPRGVGDSGERQ